MSRYVPDIPATTRADMIKLKPSGDQVNNPQPDNELKVRGAYRQDAKTPHTGKVDYRTHGKLVDADAPRYQDATEQRYLEKPTHRGTQDTAGFQPGPLSSETAALPRFGDAHYPRRHEMPAGYALRSSNQLTGVSASAATAERVFNRILDKVGRLNAAQAGAVTMGMGQQAMAVSRPTTISTASDSIGSQREQTANPQLRGMVTSASLPPSRATISDLIESKRAGELAGPMQGMAQAAMYHTMAPTNIATNTDRGFNSKRTLEQPGVVPMNMAQQDANFQEGYAIPRTTDHDPTKRAQVQFAYGDYYNKSDSQFQAGARYDGKNEQFAHKSEDYRQDAGSMRNAGAVPGAGGLQTGQQQILWSSGKRAGTGNVSATSYLHGGGDGIAFQDERVFNRDTFTPQKQVDRSQTRDFHAIQQMAMGTNQGM
jgi:hypothetical protein